MEARHGPSMRQCLYYKTHEMLKKARTHKKMVTRKFWTDGTKMTKTANLCQMLCGLKNASFNVMKSHWKTTPTLQQDKKEGEEREIVATFIECRGYTRTIESAQ